MDNIMTLLNGSIEYQRKTSGLEKAQRILDLIKMANIRYRTYTDDAGKEINKWLGRSEKLLNRAEVFKAMEARLQNYFKKCLLEITPIETESKVLHSKLATKEAAIKILVDFNFDYLDLFEAKFLENQDLFNYDQMVRYIQVANYFEQRFQRKGIQKRVQSKIDLLIY